MLAAGHQHVRGGGEEGQRYDDQRSRDPPGQARLYAPRCELSCELIAGHANSELARETESTIVTSHDGAYYATLHVSKAARGSALRLVHGGQQTH